MYPLREVRSAKAEARCVQNDDFAAIISAVKWGRCVYDNICKFLQFQLTVNITAIVIACIGSAVLTESPLTAIQVCHTLVQGLICI